VLKLAALAFMPIAAVTFGAMAVALAFIPGLQGRFDIAATTYYGAAALSIIVAAPLAWVVARRMLTQRERRLLDAGVGARH
jgi:hypothetical protein